MDIQPLAEARKKIRGPSASVGMTERVEAPQNPHLSRCGRPPCVCDTSRREGLGKILDSSLQQLSL